MNIDENFFGSFSKLFKLLKYFFKDIVNLSLILLFIEEKNRSTFCYYF